MKYSVIKNHFCFYPENDAETERLSKIVKSSVGEWMFGDKNYFYIDCEQSLTLIETYNTLREHQFVFGNHGFSIDEPKFFAFPDDEKITMDEYKKLIKEDD